MVGTALANRNHHGLENLIGFFVNSLVIRSRPDQQIFTEFLSEVRETTLAAFAHQDLPFNTLVEALQDERSDDFNPLFNIMFALQNAPKSKLQMQGVTLEDRALPHASAKFELFVSLTENPDQSLLMSWEFMTDLFHSETVSHWMALFETLLGELVTAPTQTVDRLSLVPRGQEASLRQLANAPQHPFLKRCRCTRALKL